MKVGSVKLLFKITSTSVPLESITFPLDSAIETAPYVVKSIDGLGPPDVNVIIGNTLEAGGIFQARMPQAREIVMTVGFQPNYSAGENAGTLREALYAFMAPKLAYPLTFMVRNESNFDFVMTTGYIRRFETSIFSKDPEVQITIACLDPYLTAPNTYFVPSPASLGHNPAIITNAGTAPTGFNLSATLLTSASYFELYDSRTEKLRFTYAFLVGDVVSISTNIGSLSASVFRSPNTTNLLPYISASSFWLQFHTGEQRLYINGPTDWTFGNIFFTPKYWGV